MPIYTLICQGCGEYSEHIMHHDEHRSEVKCPCCAMPLSRMNNRAWMVDGPSMQMQGDTVPGGCNYDYYDEHLGVRVRSKQHRQDEMLKQGLQDYSPDPELKSMRSEAAYIRAHAPAGDAEASAAAAGISKAAVKKRREKQIDKVFESAKLPTVNLD